MKHSRFPPAATTTGAIVPRAKRAKANVSLCERIVQAHQASDETYGMPRIRAELADAGVHASRKRIAALMRAMHIQGVSRRRAWCVTSERNKRQRPAPDLVKREFVAQDMNQLWVADMTYVPTWEGFLYLAVVTDVYSRKVVGWAFGNRCREMGVRPSMGTVGDAYDNAMAESFFASLECELIARRSWKTKTEARMAIFTWIESWYNLHRRHSALNYLSPNNFERKHTERINEAES